jgi:hypothetical protein
MSHPYDLSQCRAGSTLEYCILSTFGSRNALEKKLHSEPHLHYCSPSCRGSMSPELWTWRIVYEDRTIVFDGACLDCLNQMLRQALNLNLPTYECLSSDLWIPTTQKIRPPKHYGELL